MAKEHNYFLMIAITLGVACFQQGWFYANQFTSLSLMIGWIAFVAFILLRKSFYSDDLQVNQNRRAPSSFIGQTLWLMPLALTCVFIIQLFLSPINVKAHIESIIRFAFYTSFCLTITKLARSLSGLRWLQVAWYGVATITVISALGSLYGLWDIPHVLWQHAYNTRTEDDSMTTRLAGVLQYPNTFGALMAVFVLERLMALSLVARREVTQPYTALFYREIQLVITLWALICFLLSGSRGAYIAMFIGWVIGLFMLQVQARMKYVGYTMSLFIGAVIIVKPLIQTNLSPIPLTGIAHLLIITLAVLLLSYGGEVYFRKFVQATPIVILLGIVLVGVTVAIRRLPSVLNIDTWLARKFMYQDAWQLFTASPWWGYGGGTWRSAVYHIQHMAYVGKEVHSGYLDILLNTGVIGLTILLIGLGTIAYSMITTRSPLLPPYSVLLLHAAIDFDLSYGIVWMLLFLLIGMHIAVIAKTQYIRRSCAIKEESNRFLRTLRAKIYRRMPSVVHAMLCVVLLTSLAIGIRHTISVTIWNGAKYQPLEYQQTKLKDAISWAAYQSEARIALAKQAPLEQAEAILSEGIFYDRLNFELWLLLGKVQVARQDPKAVNTLLQAVNLNPYSTVLQEEVLSQLGGLSTALAYNDRQQAAVEVAVKGYHLYLSYEQLVHHSLQQPAFKNDRQFKMSLQAQHWGQRLAAKGMTE